MPMRAPIRIDTACEIPLSCYPNLTGKNWLIEAAYRMIEVGPEI